ncbi:MAG: DUF4349 domain-containing protein [Anaerolineales bacterium]
MKRLLLVALLLLLLMAGCASESLVETGMRQEADEYSFAEEEPAGGAPAQAQGTGAPLPQQRMIVYTGDLNLVVRDTLEVQDEIGELVDDLDGYVLSTDSYRYAEGLLRVNMSLRVPAERFQEAMSALRSLALEVNRESVSAQDVTQEYVDLESRLRALEAKAERLEALMEEAEDTEAVLAVYEELSATQEEIEQVKGRMQYLERSAAMATINVSLEPDELARPVEIAGWRPGGVAKRAIEALISAAQFLVNALIWIVLFALPVLLVVGLVIYGVVRLVLFIFRKLRREKT